jgi:hypothetical protein
MIVVQSKSIKRQLKVLGLPNEPNTLLVASQKGYITIELFIKLIIEILIPSVIFCRAQFDLENSHALLVVDGATQHQSLNIINALKSANIMYFLVPHSSHLTQPLDCLFFKCFKGELRKPRVHYTDLSKTSNQLIHTISSLSKIMGWFIRLRSWHCAGFLVLLEDAIPTITYDLSIILKRKNTPTNEIKVQVSKTKRKQKKIFFSHFKKTKKNEKKDDENIIEIEEAEKSNQ